MARSTVIQSPLSFCVFEKTLTMYILRESWGVGDFEKLKIFGFFVPFCIQNGIWRFWWFWPNRPTELTVPFLIFWSPNGKDYEKMVFGGFSWFLAVFWVKKWNFKISKIFKIGQKFDFHKICLNHYPMSYKHRKWFFGPQKHFFCQYIMIFIHLRQLFQNEFLGQKSTFSGFSML